MCLTMLLTMLHPFFPTYFEYDGVSYPVVQTPEKVTQFEAASVCSDTFHGEIFYNQTTLVCITEKLASELDESTKCILQV